MYCEWLGIFSAKDQIYFGGFKRTQSHQEHVEISYENFFYTQHKFYLTFAFFSLEWCFV